MNAAEEWRPVVGWEEFYDVSNHGRVRTRLTRSRYPAGMILNLELMKAGYTIQ